MPKTKIRKGEKKTEVIILVAVSIRWRPFKRTMTEATWRAAVSSVRSQLKSACGTSSFIGGVGYFIPKVKRLGKTQTK